MVWTGEGHAQILFTGPTRVSLFFYKQSMMVVGYFLDEVDMTYEDHEEYVRGLIMKNDVSFASLKGTSNQTAIRFGMQ